MDKGMSDTVQRFLNHEAVRNYYQACEAMQSPEVLGLLRQLPNELHIPDLLGFAKRLDRVSVPTEDGVSSPDAMLFLLDVMRQQEQFDYKACSLNIRDFDYAIVQHRDALTMMYHLLHVYHTAIESGLVDTGLTDQESVHMSENGLERFNSAVLSHHAGYSDYDDECLVMDSDSDVSTNVLISNDEENIEDKMDVVSIDLEDGEDSDFESE